MEVSATFANLPRPPPRMCPAGQAPLEGELRSVLLDSRNPVITLRGAGDRKTSLALRVVHDLCLDGRFFMALWLSAVAAVGWGKSERARHFHR